MHKFQQSGIFILFCTSIVGAQQEYSGESVFDCESEGRTATPSASYLYTCNGWNHSCRSFLIYRAQPDYDSVSNISRLLSSSPWELARINNVSNSYAFPTNKEVIVPVNCSCAGQYYQANTSHLIGHEDAYYLLAQGLYQGLASCKSLVGENPYDPENLRVGQKLLIPLRCACPTRKQAAQGTNYLLTYPISENDSLPDLSYRFNVSNQNIVFANGFSEQDPLVYIATTILIPFPREPSSFQTIIQHPIQYPQPWPPPFIDPVVKKSKEGLRIGIGIGVAALILLCTAIPIAFWIRKRRLRRRIEKKQCLGRKEILDAIAGVDHVLKMFDVGELKEATNNFSSECRIKGLVYRGFVRGVSSAIKEMRREVAKEVNMLHKLNHVNLITLRGISVGQENFYLVYEYMENGSLKNWLHDTSRSGFWSWMQRVQIALDVANGLNYLHNFTEPPCVHKNINSSNVLLDSNLRAKIANFSFARSSERKDGGFSVTSKTRGTIGYMAPEYLKSGVVTPMLDVFAFGVILAELVTGKDAVIKHERERMLTDVIISIVEGTNAEVELSDFMDATMRGKWQRSLPLAMAKLSVACMKKDPKGRPSMNEVVSILLRIQRDQQDWEVDSIDIT